MHSLHIQKRKNVLIFTSIIWGQMLLPNYLSCSTYYFDLLTVKLSSRSWLVLIAVCFYYKDQLWNKVYGKRPLPSLLTCEIPGCPLIFQDHSHYVILNYGLVKLLAWSNRGLPVFLLWWSNTAGFFKPQKGAAGCLSPVWQHHNWSQKEFNQLIRTKMDMPELAHYNRA